MEITKKILIVDDEVIMRDLLVDYFEMFDYKTDIANDGQEALEKVLSGNGNESYNLVISDINMPKMGGTDLLKRIKEKFKNLPVIIMTGYGTENVKDEISLADGFLNKPFELDKITEMISMI